MAIVNKVTPETIELLRGKIDFYMLRGILPVARRWPKKPKPPYSELQAEAMAVFGIANNSMHRISDNILEKWREGSVGKKASWTDTYRGIIMRYWKQYKVIAPIVIDYLVTETSTGFNVTWDILQLFINPDMTEEIYQLESKIIDKEDILKVQKPIYYTLILNAEIRVVCPYILFDLY